MEKERRHEIQYLICFLCFRKERGKPTGFFSIYSSVRGNSESSNSISTYYPVTSRTSVYQIAEYDHKQKPSDIRFSLPFRVFELNRSWCNSAKEALLSELCNLHKKTYFFIVRSVVLKTWGIKPEVLIEIYYCCQHFFMRQKMRLHRQLRN